MNRTRGVHRIVVVVSVLLAGPHLMSSGEAYPDSWEESCRIHKVIEAQQDAERRRIAEDAVDPDLRKAALKDGGGFGSELLWGRLEQANLIIHVRDLSRCMDDFVDKFPARMKEQVHDVFFEKLLIVILALFGLILSAAALGFAIGSKRKKSGT